MKNTLYPDDFRDLVSPYLDAGYRSERPVIEEIKIHPPKTVARCSIVDPVVSPTDTSFHLTTVSCHVLVTQVACISVLHSRGFTRKEHEVFIIEHSFEALGPVRTPDTVSIELDCIGEIDRRNVEGHPLATLFKFRYDVAQQMRGTLSASVSWSS